MKLRFILDTIRFYLVGVLDPGELILMVKSQELVQVFGIVWRVFCESELTQVAGVTCKICLKLAGVKNRHTAFRIDRLHSPGLRFQVYPKAVCLVSFIITV